MTSTIAAKAAEASNDTNPGQVPKPQTAKKKKNRSRKNKYKKPKGPTDTEKIAKAAEDAELVIGLLSEIANADSRIPLHAGDPEDSKVGAMWAKCLMHWLRFLSLPHGEKFWLLVYS